MSANRLAGETSPYLQQHADNPVDWYPWGEEALKLAREQDKPILLSIGYSACHWCHVMAHESFEDPAVAEVMNRLFINIKVDREERPDLDQIYQTAHSLLTQRAGGWPLTMFLSPDQKPFFGGTYFPKTSRHGLPGFTGLLEQVAAAYRDQRAQIEEQNASLLEVLQQTQPVRDGQATELNDTPIDSAIDALIATFDRQHGGFGGAPKFPHPAELEFCLYFAKREPRLREHALFTLEKMASSGIYDQLGGGFSRYSVDQQWMIPHFEKMLYDNGPLLSLYADAWRLERSPRFKRVVEETAAWVMREMQSEAGGYFSSLDADSEGAEGRYYVWSRDQVRQLIDEDEYSVVSAHYGLDGEPNFEHQDWHLHVFEQLDVVASQLEITEQRARELFDSARQKLLAAREQRVRPGRDEKILVSWNALMIRGMARAARVFGRKDWLESARRAAQFVAEHMFDGTRLLATFKDGRAQLNAYLDDYAFLVLALLELVQVDFRSDELEFARTLSDALLARFEDMRDGGFYFVSHEHEPLILRPKPGHDNATPSGNAVAALALLRIGYMLGETRYLASAERALRLFAPLMARRPGGFATMGMALSELLAPTRTVILRGSPERLEPWQRELSDSVDGATLLLALDAAVQALPAVLDKPAPDSGVNAYLCQGVSCLRPVQDMAALRALMDQANSPVTGS
jgi:uncharacterized protein YyaL (SSP411 family)